MKNTQKRNLWISYGIGLIGIILSLSPEFMNMNVYEGGGATLTIGVFIAISGWLVGFLLFKEKARIMDNALDEMRVVAKWTYDASSWKRKMTEEKQDMKAASIGILIMILLIGTIVFVPMMIIVDGDEKLAVLTIYGVFIVFGLFGIYLNYRRIKYIEDKAYVIITRDGAVLNGEVEWWRGRGRGFEEAIYDRESNSIVVRYCSYFTKGARERTVTIPVPDYIRLNKEEVVSRINMEGN